MADTYTPTDTGTVRVDPSNTAQLDAWDGDEGAFWASHADHFDRSVAAYHRRLLAIAAIAATDRVLDIGCGTGQTTRDAARIASDGSALGIDLSRQMLTFARHRAAVDRIQNVRFEQADAQVRPFDAGAFDLAISRTGAMFFGDPVAAFTNIARALRAGGRIALTAWQPLDENEWIRELSGALAVGRPLPAPPPGAPGPFALAEPTHVHAVLGAAGFTDVALEAMRAGMWFGDDADDALGFVLGTLGWMLAEVDGATRERAHAALRATIDAHTTPGGVVYDSAAWIITARRA